MKLDKVELILALTQRDIKDLSEGVTLTKVMGKYLQIDVVPVMK